LRIRNHQSNLRGHTSRGGRQELRARSRRRL